MELIDYLKTEWAVISQAPLTFVAGAFILGIMMYGIVRLQFTDRLSSLNERLKLKDDRIFEYKRSTGADTPDQARRLISELEKRLEALEPRKLEESQIETLTEKLRQISGFVGLYRDASAANAVLVTTQIQEAFSKSKWKIASGSVLGLGFHPPTGILITTRTGEALVGDAKLVVEAFELAEIPFDLRKQSPENAKGWHNDKKPVVEILTTSS